MEELNQIVEIENLISECTDNSIMKLTKLSHVMNDNWFFKAILFFGNNNMFFKLTNFIKLFEIFNKTKKLERIALIPNAFYQYLWCKNLIPHDFFHWDHEFSQEEIIRKTENPINQNTIWYYIYCNDIQKFVRYITTHDINIIEEKHCFFSKTYKLLDFACYCGSLDIVKYLVINKCKLYKSIIFGLMGNQENVLEFMIEKGISFEKYLSIPIIYHHNKLAKWICDNSSGINYQILSYYAIDSMNTEILLYSIMECHHNPFNGPFDGYSPTKLAESIFNEKLAQFLENNQENFKKSMIINN